jgi:hypothetical protein
MGARKDFTTCEGVPGELLAGICQNPDCGRHMRKLGVSKKLAPHTLAYGHSGKCKSCVQPNTLRSIIATDMKSDSGVEQTISGLQRYLAARSERGIQPEPDNGIRWGSHVVA